MITLFIIGIIWTLLGFGLLRFCYFLDKHTNGAGGLTFKDWLFKDEGGLDFASGVAFLLLGPMGLFLAVGHLVLLIKNR